MLVIVLHEAVRILAHLEEVGLLTLLLYRASAVRALAVHELGIGPEGLTWGTVPALVLGLVDVALVVHLLEHLLYLLLMIVVGGTDELVVGGVHEVPDGLDVAGSLVDESLRCHAGRSGLLLDLLAMLVGSGLELDVVALESLVSCDGVGQDDLICVSDMRLAGCIGNRSGDVVRFLFHNTRFPGARMEGDLMYRSGTVCGCINLLTIIYLGRKCKNRRRGRGRQQPALGLVTDAGCYRLRLSAGSVR